LWHEPAGQVDAKAAYFTARGGTLKIGAERISRKKSAIESGRSAGSLANMLLTNWANASLTLRLFPCSGGMAERKCLVNNSLVVAPV
jgi:hypothetical protein